MNRFVTRCTADFFLPAEKHLGQGKSWHRTARGRLGPEFYFEGPKRYDSARPERKPRAVRLREVPPGRLALSIAVDLGRVRIECRLLGARLLSKFIEHLTVVHTAPDRVCPS